MSDERLAASGLGSPTRDPAPTALDLPEKAEQPGSVTKRAADRAAGLCSTQPSAAQGTPPVPPLVTAWCEARPDETRSPLDGVEYEDADTMYRIEQWLDVVRLAGDALAAECVRLTRDLDVARRLCEKMRDETESVGMRSFPWEAP